MWFYDLKYILCASGSVVEYRLAKARVAGSNPVSRFFYFPEFLGFTRNFGLSCVWKSVYSCRQAFLQAGASYSALEMRGLLFS